MPTPSPTPLADVGRPGSVGADGSLPGGSVIGYRFARIPHAQTLTADGNTLSITGPRLHVSGAADRKITATPSITAGSVVGQEVQIVNTGTKLITLQGSALASSGVKLCSPFVTLAPNRSIVVAWDGSSWNEIHRATYGSADELDVRDFGAVADGVTNDWPAFKAMHDAFIPGSLSGGSWRGGAMHVANPGAGSYYLTQTWVITKRVIVRGDGMGFQAGSAPTYIKFAAGVAGIRLYSAEPDSPDGGSAAYSVIRDLQVDSAGGGTAVGIYASCVVYLERVIAGDFGGDGFLIKANAAVDGSGNANSSRITSCQALSNGGDGFHLQGSDVNSTKLNNCFSSHNGAWQYNVESYLGCYLDNCNAECELGLGTYRTTGGGSTLRDCYIEYGSNYTHAVHPNDVIDLCNFDFQQAAPFIEITGDGDGRATAIVNALDGAGGIGSVLMTCQGTGYTNATVTVTRGGGGGTGAAFTPHFGAAGEITGITVANAGTGFPHWTGCSSMAADGSGALRMTAFRMMQRSQGIRRAVDLWAGGYGTNGAPLLSASVADVHYPGEPDRFDQIAWNNATMCFETQFNHSDTYTGIRHVHPLAVGQTGGRSTRLPTNSVMLVQGYWLGDGAAARFRGIATRAQCPPTAGEWAPGDEIAYSDPLAGGFRGIVCVTGGVGVLAVWKTWGQISA